MARDLRKVVASMSERLTDEEADASRFASANPTDIGLGRPTAVSAVIPPKYLNMPAIE